MAEEECKLGYTPGGTDRELDPVATAREVGFVATVREAACPAAIAQEVDPAARAKPAPICRMVQQEVRYQEKL